MSQDGAVAKLVIHELDVEDTGAYTCVCGDRQTTATLTVKGKGKKVIVFSEKKSRDLVSLMEKS